MRNANLDCSRSSRIGIQSATRRHTLRIEQLEQRLMLFSPGELIDEFVPSGVGAGDTSHLEIGPDEQLYVANEGQVSRYDVETGEFLGGFIRTVDYPFGAGVFQGRGGSPPSFEFGPDGILYATGASETDEPGDGERSVHRFDGTTGAWIDEFIPFIPHANGSLAIGPDGNLYLGNVFCACREDPSHVQRYNRLTGEFMDVFVPDGSGGLFAGLDLEFGPDGDLYVASNQNNKVLRYDGNTGAFLEEVLSDVFAFGLTFDESGTLFVGGGQNIVRASAPNYSSTAEVFDISEALGDDVNATLDGLIVSPTGGLFVAAEEENILHYDAETINLISNIEGGVDIVDRPSALAFGPNGGFYVADEDQDSILRFDGATGELLEEFVGAGAGGLDRPMDIAFGPDENLYVVSRGTHQILRYHGLTGDFIDVFAEGAEPDYPWTLEFGADNNLYVGSARDDEVRLYDGTTGAPLGAFVSAGSGVKPYGLAFGPDGDLYVSSSSGGVRRYDGTTGAPQGVFVAAGSGDLRKPRDLTFGPDGNLYVGGTLDSSRRPQVFRYDGQSGAFVDHYGEIIVGLAISVSVNQGGVRDVLFGEDGHLYAADFNNHRVLRFAGPIQPSDVVGDYNKDGRVTGADLGVWSSDFGEQGANLSADGDGDNDVDGNDFLLWQRALEPADSPSADFDNNSIVNGADFLAWQRGIGTSPPATKSDGDADNDGDVDSVDRAIWEAQFGDGAGTLAAVRSPNGSGASRSAASAGLVDPSLIDAAMAVEALSSSTVEDEALLVGQSPPADSTATVPLPVGDRIGTKSDSKLPSAASPQLFGDEQETPSEQSLDAWLAEELLEKIFG